MKIKFAGAIAGICIAGILLNGCTTKDDADVVNSKKNEAVAENKTTASETEETTEAGGKWSRDEVTAMTKAYREYLKEQYENRKPDGYYSIEYACRDINNDGIPEILYYNKFKSYSVIYLEKGEDGEYCVNEIREISYKREKNDINYDEGTILTYYPETGTFCGNTTMKDNGMGETEFKYYRLNDFELQNMEFGSAIVDSPKRTSVLNYTVKVPSSFFDTFDQDLNQMIDYYQDSECEQQEDESSSIKWIDHSGESDTRMESISYQKTDDQLQLYLVYAVDYDKTAAENIYNNIEKIKKDWLGDSASSVKIYDRDFSTVLPDNDNESITFKDLAEYTNKKYFWDLFDCEY